VASYTAAFTTEMANWADQKNVANTA
jgi:hypothetical protein